VEHGKGTNAFGDSDRSLSAVLRAVAADERRLGASPAVEAALTEAVLSIARERRRQQWTVTAAAAVLMLAVGSLTWQLATRQLSPDAVSRVAVSSLEVTGEIGTTFFPLAYNDVPAFDGQIVRVDVPREALAAFGLAPAEAMGDPAALTLAADVFVGEDGLARAIRFVRPFREQKEQNR
jgi:hypothetical protein